MPASPMQFGPSEAVNELRKIADWWLNHTFDTQYGGFIGEIDYCGRPITDANKGVILNSRILWFFSEACLFEYDSRYQDAADRAYQYLIDRFDDREHGGVVWELAADGSLINGKKQIYALSFCIYAFTSYYKLTSKPEALNKSHEYFHAIETNARDDQLGGYFEAFSQDWQKLSDVRLGETDLNAPKTMNTHLHLLEAYTALHTVAPCEQTREALRNTIDLFCEHFIDPDSGHLRLFFDNQWNCLSSVVSFGHDIEASWLLWEAAETLAEPALKLRVRPIVERLASVCQHEGIGDAGQLCNEYDPLTLRRAEGAVWWVQAEALVGFLYACKLTGEPKYRRTCDKIWRFICDYQIDAEGGEWHWLSTHRNSDAAKHYKAGFWKAPYHNGRSMLVACKLFSELN